MDGPAITVDGKIGSAAFNVGGPADMIKFTDTVAEPFTAFEAPTVTTPA
jgi:hypothetical protein